VGAYCDALDVLKKHDSYRNMPKANKYTAQDFCFDFDTTKFFRGLYQHGVFSRGLPARSDLMNNKYATSLLQVLNAPGQCVVVTEDQDRKKDNPLRQCLERGWLFSERESDAEERDAEERIKYRFASKLHERYVDWLLRGRKGPIEDPDLPTFVINVLQHFRRMNLRRREDLTSSNSAPQSIPEAQFQQEFYRACCDYTNGTVITLPECGTANGQIDFFVRSQKWGIELLRNGDRRAAHNARFTTGEYGKWIKDGKMDDYIMIDFRSKLPTRVDKNDKFLYVVSTNSWESMQIYNHELTLIRDQKVLYD